MLNNQLIYNIEYDLPSTYFARAEYNGELKVQAEHHKK